MTLEELKLNLKWWESKRWIFNILVGVFGVIAIWNVLAEILHKWTFYDTIGVIIWGIGANVFYSLGILLELFDWYYLDNKIGIKKYRLFFFLIGTFLSCIYTFCNVIAFSIYYL